MPQLIAANWKMHGRKSWASRIEALQDGIKGKRNLPEILVCPPAAYLSELSKARTGNRIKLGAQCCHSERDGAFTGDHSAEMFADLGADYVICGHSERRQHHGETNRDVHDKVMAVWRAGMSAIICIGESEGQRNDGDTLKVLEAQLKHSVPDGMSAEKCVIAYEPIWAIGTGKTPTEKDIVQVHSHIRNRLLKRFGRDAKGIRITYGGSVKPANAESILALEDVGGALVGGASLEADSFLKIILAAPSDKQAGS